MMTIIRLLVLLLITGTASAQGIGGIITDRPSAERLPEPDYAPEKRPPGFSLPPASTQTPKATPDAAPKMSVKGFRFTGHSVFTDADLQAIAKPYLDRPIGTADLEQLRHELTQHYIDHGYINSGATLPQQVFKEGIIHFQIIEGELSEIRVTGTGWLRPNYVRNRLARTIGPPLKNQALQDRFQLLLTDPLIERMDGRLMPGLSPGESILNVKVTRARPYQLTLSADNYSPPSIGAEQVRLDGWLYNISGFGDHLNLSLGASEGRFDINTGFSIPLNRYDTRLVLRYANTHASVIEEPLDEIDIENRFLSYELALTHPIYRTLQRSAIFGARLAVRKSRNTLRDQPFPFSLGEDDGKSKVSALRLFQEFVDSQHQQVFSVRSTFNVGLDLFDATWHDDGRPDGNFFSWLGQLRYARQVMDNGAEIRLRGDVQLTDDRLLPLERFAAGGVYSVRGYRENELVRDQGYALSAEFHYPVLHRGIVENFPGVLTAIPFMDYGAAWNHGAGENTDYLHSVGIGLTWAFKRLSAELYYAHDLNQAPDRQDDDLQDSGIHFRVSASLF